MEEACEAYVHFIYKYLSEQPYTRFFVEMPVYSAEFPSEHWGTPDLTVDAPRFLRVTDFKYGLLDVAATGNDQLKSYLSMARDMLGYREKYIGDIVQPRVKAPETVEFTDADLDEHKEAVRRAIGNTTRCAGKWCTYCPLIRGCNENREYQLTLARTWFDNPTIEQCMEVVEAAPAFVKLLEMAKKTLKAKALSGMKVPGQKLIMALNDRAFADQNETVAKLSELGVPEWVLWKQPKLNSPAQIEEYAKSLDKETKKRVRKAVKSLVHRTEKGPALVPESRNAPTYVPGSVLFDLLDKRENDG